MQRGINKFETANDAICICEYEYAYTGKPLKFNQQQNARFPKRQSQFLFLLEYSFGIDSIKCVKLPISPYRQHFR